jgi:hypothetical protein
MENSIKNTLINNYLQDQLRCSNGDEDNSSNVGGGNGGGGNNNKTLCNIVEMPDNNSLEQFKNQVRSWVEIDNNVKALKQAIKDRNVVKKDLTDKILRFMIKFNIEDLNTKDGSKLRYKVNQVTKNPTAKDIKKRLVENYHKVNNAEDLSNTIFICNKVDKPTLRRLKN